MIHVNALGQICRFESYQYIGYNEKKFIASSCGDSGYIAYQVTR